MAADRTAWIVVIAGASLIAVASARPHAGGWNDGSRLATVESLVDRHTWAIDDSLFVKVAAVTPYEGNVPLGTFDKLWIDGRWYSDKSPVPALLLALVYQLLQWMTGLTAAVQPQLFCYLMTVLSSGAAYVAGVAGIHWIATELGLPRAQRLGVTLSFAGATLALVYVRHVNNHIILLGVAVALVACQTRLAQAGATSRGTLPRGTLLLLGCLGGLAYTIDLGAGPPLLLGAVVLAGWRTRSAKAVALVVLAALPWLTLHHAANWAIGGTLRPANANPEYLAWPSSPFAGNLTGQWNHADAGRFGSYAVQLLVGKKGFLGHNLPLLLVLPAVFHLGRLRTRYLPEVWCCLATGGVVWLAYAAGSTNYAGACCSIRWLVPLVGLGYFVLIVFLREAPEFAGDLATLSVGGAALMASAWPGGPWRLTVLPAYWPLLALTLIAWGAYRGRAIYRRAIHRNRSCPAAASGVILCGPTERMPYVREGPGHLA